MEEEPEQTSTARTSPPARTPLTPGMKAVLFVAAALVVVGVVLAIWLFASAGTGATSGNPDASASSAPMSTAGPVPGATPTSGSEVLPPTATTTGRLPSLESTTPLVPGPLPESGTNEGALVEGFPAEIMGEIEGSEILSSSIAAAGDTMQVTLVARTDATPESIRSHYAALWASLGLSESTASDGNLAYTGPYESLTLAVSTAGTGIQYSIYGVFRTK